MPEITSYVQGTPSWVDLATTDEKGALAFYSALFKWEDDPEEMGPDSLSGMQCRPDIWRGCSKAACRPVNPPHINCSRSRNLQRLIL